jgi:hypothetical protein
MAIGWQAYARVVTKYGAVVAAAQRTADAADDAYKIARVDFAYGDPVVVAVLDAQTRAHAALTAVQDASNAHKQRSLGN